VIDSRHFKVEELAKGVYAAIHREGGWAVANAGIIDIGEYSLVFDTFITVQAAGDLRQAAEELTGKPVGIVVNSHYHNDHIWGNQVFDTQIDFLSTVETRQLIETDGMQEYHWYRDNSDIQLKAFQSQYESEKDQSKRQVISTWISYYTGLVESLPLLSIRPPNITFADRLQIYGEGRQIELIEFKHGHTSSDVILNIPADGIIFMSDLLFVGCHPYLADGNPENFPIIYKKIRSLQAKVLVPGHGPVGGLGDMSQIEEYIQHCDRLASELAAAGDKAVNFNALQIPSEYSSWNLSQFYAANLNFLYRRHATWSATSISQTKTGKQD